MKKFVVRITKKSLFKKNALAVFEHTFDHATDAYRYAKSYREMQERDNRWPLISLEILFK